MRKIFLLLFCVILLCGCSKNTTIKPQTQNLEFTVTAKIKKQEYIFNAKSDSLSNLTLALKKPENLKGLTLNFNGETCVLEFLEIKKEFPFENIEKESPIKIFYEGFLKAKNTENLEYSDDQYFLDYRLEDDKFRFHFSQSGLPLSIIGQNNDIKIIISSLKISN